MNRKIIELDQTTINKIAAGEVVERPASVVKELVENAIDAEATSIFINVEEGGKKLIEIIDDGIGMTHDDALLAIKPHTTSKIRTADDLFSINSLGFRGEALASIVSIARVDVVTRAAETDLGAHIVVEGGEVKVKERTSTKVGTRITVRNLFYNVPVRRKFLKTTSTELNHISEYATKLALSYPHLSFQLNHNDRKILSAPKGDLLTNISSIFGTNVAKACIPVSITKEQYSISGYITKPEFTRKTINYMYLFVNGRSVHDKTIIEAIMKGYGTAIPHNRYPITFLTLSLPFNEVDCNVHPTKKEVRFSREDKIFSVFEQGVRTALEASGLKIFETSNEPMKQKTLFDSPSTTGFYTSKDDKSVPLSPPTKSSPSNISKVRTKVLGQYFEKDKKYTTFQTQKIEKHKKTLSVLGIYDCTYILAKMSDGIVICDQHAAHEKINYIKYLDQIKTKSISIQELLAPLTINLKPSEVAIIDTIKEKMQELGFLIDFFGGNDILIRAVPSVLGKTISAKIAQDIIDIFIENEDKLMSNMTIEDLDFVKDMVALMSCRRSVKSGDKLSLPQAEQLLHNLLKTKDPYTCPHGRPTMIILNNDYLEKLFGRDYKV